MRSQSVDGRRRAWSRSSHRTSCVTPTELAAAIAVPTEQVARAIRASFLPSCRCQKRAGAAASSCDEDFNNADVAPSHHALALLQAAITARAAGRCPLGCTRVTDVPVFSAAAEFATSSLQVFSSGSGGSDNIVLLLLGIGAACVGLILGITAASFVIQRQSRSTNRTAAGKFPPHSAGALRAPRMGLMGRPQLYEVYAQPKPSGNGPPYADVPEPKVVDVAPTADLGSSWTMVDDDDNTEPDEAMMRKARKNPYDRPDAVVPRGSAGIDAIANPDSMLSPL